MRTASRLFLMTACLLFNCADRQRSNPLDPLNPVTQGKPTGLKASSSLDTVFLRWDQLTIDDLSGIQLYRRAGPGTRFLPFVFLSGQATAFTDSDVDYGVNFSYQISAVGDNYESEKSDVIEIEPGPANVWVATNPGGSNTLLQLTHDARHVRQAVSGFRTIIDIEPFPNDGNIWLLDSFSSFFTQAVQLTGNVRFLPPAVDVNGATDAAVVHATGELWIANPLNSLVFKLNSSGVRVAGESGFAKPTALAVDQRNATCWVADQGTQTVVKLDANGARVAVADMAFNGVQSIAVNSRNGAVWVAENQKVIRFSESGQRVQILPWTFGSVRKIAVNDSTGSVWILDWQPSTVYKFSDGGEMEIEMGGFFNPRDLAINLFDNTCLVADTENGRLVKIEPDGRSVTTVQELVYPTAVAVQNARP